MSAILVLMAVIILVLRSVLEYKGQQAAKAEKGQQEDRNALQQKGGTDYGRITAGHRKICRAS